MEAHAFDQAASNATVQIICPATASGSPVVDNGHPVFQVPRRTQSGGTYSVESSGEGTLKVDGDKSGLNFDVTDMSSNEIGNILLVRSALSETSMETGIAIRIVNGDVHTF